MYTTCLDQLLSNTGNRIISALSIYERAADAAFQSRLEGLEEQGLL